MKEKKNFESQILVVGSIAFDIVFTLYSKIQDQINIIDGKAGKQNLMFNAKNKKQFFGGTAGNISYGLGLLGAVPLTFSVAGKDFSLEYKKHLEKAGVNLKVFIDAKGWTATYYGMTDKIGEQIGVWQPNAYGEHIEKISLLKTISPAELKRIQLAIFAAGVPKSTIRHMNDLKKVNPNAKIFFDPGQSLNIYTKEFFNKALSRSDFLLGNDIEIRYIKKHFGFRIEDALNAGKIIIETKGKEGSLIHEKKGVTSVPAFKPKKVVDVTGAGDAFRSGLLFGLHQGLSLRDSAKIGAKVAAHSIEHVGGQHYVANKKNISR